MKRGWAGVSATPQWRRDVFYSTPMQSRECFHKHCAPANGSWHMCFIFPGITGEAGGSTKPSVCKYFYSAFEHLEFGQQGGTRVVIHCISATSPKLKTNAVCLKDVKFSVNPNEKRMKRGSWRLHHPFLCFALLCHFHYSSFLCHCSPSTHNQAAMWRSWGEKGEALKIETNKMC